MAFAPATPTGPDPDSLAPYALNNVRMLTGKVARALYGPSYTQADAQFLNEDQLRDLVADAVAKLIFYSNGLWPFQLTVTVRDANGLPQEYHIDPTHLPIQDETLVVSQAALDFFFFEFKDKKVVEEISDEGQKWLYNLSASTLLEMYKGLRLDRDKALEMVVQRAGYITDYVSFIGQRDALTSAMVEWWVRPGLTYPSGQEIFPSIAAFGG